MKNILAYVAIIACLFSCDNSDPSPAVDSDDQAVVDDLNQLAKQIDGVEGDLVSNDITFLDDIADARMIGLGEATHGSKEFSLMKYRMFRYLAEKRGFRGIVFEIDVAEAMIFEDYIQGRRNEDISTLMKEKMLFWVWRTMDVRDMLIWMRSYNSSRGDADRVHIFGMDCQYTIYNADRLVSIIQSVDSELANDIDDHLKAYRLLNGGESDTSVYRPIGKQIAYVIQQIADHKAELMSGGLTDNDYENAAHLARVISQTQQDLLGVRLNDYSVRDKFMAENALWVLNHFDGGQSSKICLWAHDFHIATGFGDQNEGSILRTELQNNYKNVGFSFGKGGFNAVNNGTLSAMSITADPPKNSIEHFFSLSYRKMFSLNLSAIDSSHPALFNVVSTERQFKTIGSVYNNKPDDYYGALILNQNFNIVLYFDQVTAAQFLQY